MNFIITVLLFTLIIQIIYLFLTIANKELSQILKRSFSIVLIAGITWTILSIITLFEINEKFLILILKFEYIILTLFWLSIFVFGGIISWNKSIFFRVLIWVLSAISVVFIILVFKMDLSLNLYTNIFLSVKENTILLYLNLFYILLFFISITVTAIAWNRSPNGIIRLRSYKYLQAIIILFGAFLFIKLVKLFTDISLINFLSPIILIVTILLYEVITKFRLKKINIIISSIFEFFLYLIFMIGVILFLNSIFLNVLNLESGLGEFLYPLIFLVIAFPIFKLAKYLIERFLLINPYEFNELLNTILLKLSTRLQSKNLAIILTEVLPGRMGFYVIQLYIKHKGNKYKKYTKGGRVETIEINNEIFKLLKDNHDYIDIEELLLQKVKVKLEDEWKFVFPIYYHKKILGFINVIDFYKSSGRILTLEDIHLMNLIIGPASVATKNILFIDELESKNRRLRKLIRNLEVAQEKITQTSTLAALGHMAAGIAHEIRYTLGIIKNSAELLSNQDLVDADKAEILEFIISETDRLNLLVKKFLELSSPIDINKENINFWELVEFNISNYFRKIMDEKEIDLKLEGSSKGPLNLKADKDLLSQVINNLIQNSLDALPAKGGEIFISGDLRHRKDNQYVELVFKDNGSGIEKEYQSKIFNPFFTQKDSGIGLGLSLVYKIIDSHNGEIKIESDNKGTEIIITLPY